MLVQIIIYSTANNNSNETKKSILMSLFYGLYIATTLLLISVLTETIESLWAPLPAPLHEMTLTSL